jgi:hypothetical protein
MKTDALSIIWWWFFPNMCHASCLSFIHEISMSNLHPIPKCLIYTCLHAVTGIGQYWYDNNNINMHTLFNAGKLHTEF